MCHVSFTEYIKQTNSEEFEASGHSKESKIQKWLAWHYSHRILAPKYPFQISI